MPSESSPRLPAHASPAFPPLHSPKAHRPVSDFELHDEDEPTNHRDYLRHLDSTSSDSPHLPPLLSPAFTPPATPGSFTPLHEKEPRSIPIDRTQDTPENAPRLIEILPKVHCEVRARIPTTTGTEMWLYLYSNELDNKEHLAIVFGDRIRSKSLDEVRPGETERDRMVRGAYVGRLYPGRTSSRVDQLKQESRGESSNALGSKGRIAPIVPNGTPSAVPRDPTGDSERAGPQEQEQEKVRAPLVRIHSECYTGETIHSSRCDCGEQLDEAARLMSLPSARGSGGCIIYLRQEGRGIGLLAKLQAYNLQDLGHDTYEANLLLRHPADARSYGLATSILVDLGLGEIRLLTNNPEKVRAVEGPGREVLVKERVPMVPLSWRTGGRQGFTSPEVERYLSTKVSGALLLPLILKGG